MEEYIEQQVAERLDEELDAMISHLEQELDDKELFRKVVQILADDETASDG
jgi:hypothetical protein